MGKNYYERFGMVLGNPLFPFYLGWAYAQGLKDSASLGLQPDFNKTGFSCLLCGCGNEQTADTFIRFVTQRNKGAKIYIIDLGDKQIEAIKRLVVSKYNDLDIEVHQTNALDLEKIIKPQSLDWIETDGFIEYFDHPSLEKLLQVWHSLLKSDGFVTTRDCVTVGKLSQIADYLRITVADLWLGVKLYAHTKQELEALFSKIGFRFCLGRTPLYTYKRIALSIS